MKIKTVCPHLRVENWFSTNIHRQLVLQITDFTNNSFNKVLKLRNHKLKLALITTQWEIISELKIETKKENLWLRRYKITVLIRILGLELGRLFKKCQQELNQIAFLELQVTKFSLIKQIQCLNHSVQSRRIIHRWNTNSELTHPISRILKQITTKNKHPEKKKKKKKKKKKRGRSNLWISIERDSWITETTHLKDTQLNRKHRRLY